MDYYLISTGTGISIYTRPMSDAGMNVKASASASAAQFHTSNHIANQRTLSLSFGLNQEGGRNDLFFCLSTVTILLLLHYTLEIITKISLEQ